MSKTRIKHLENSANPSSIILTDSSGIPGYFQLTGSNKYFGTNNSGSVGLFDLPSGLSGFKLKRVANFQIQSSNPYPYSFTTTSSNVYTTDWISRNIQFVSYDPSENIVTADNNFIYVKAGAYLLYELVTSSYFVSGPVSSTIELRILIESSGDCTSMIGSGTPWPCLLPHLGSLDSTFNANTSINSPARINSDVRSIAYPVYSDNDFKFKRNGAREHRVTVYKQSTATVDASYNVQYFFELYRLYI